MAIGPGTQLTLYQILAPVGAGGMGEVYLARDTRLGREVAIKVLPEALPQNPERLARLEREARLLAALNHPGIATVHGLEESDGIRFLVMEHVPGETLAERIARGPIPIEEALRLFEQIAEGLEAAHEKGIVHRDLKPANVKITPAGRVKLLDFGLAIVSGLEGGASDLSQSPTVTREAIESGAIVGTPAYLSPEQARGKEVDRRTDIWAFGCCLYEALTGRPAFLGETLSDTLARILEREPDWEALPEATPALVRSLLRRCLRKSARERLRDSGDLRLEIEEARDFPAEAKFLEAEPSKSRRSLPLQLAALIGLVVLSVFVGRSVGPPRRSLSPVSRFTIPIPGQDSLAAAWSGTEPLGLALSPDGRYMAFAAGEMLYLRALDEPEFSPVRGTEGARAPFFSPDGEWVGFIAGGQLMKVAVRGGPPVVLCDVLTRYPAASWGEDGRIVISDARPDGSLYHISSEGGDPEILVSRNEDEWFLAWPEVLPVGGAVLFGSLPRRAESLEQAQIFAYSPSTGKRKKLLDGGRSPRYSPSGHLLFVRESNLFAAPFDVRSLELKGAPVLVQEGVRSVVATLPWADLSLSRNGTLAFIPGRPLRRRLVSVDRHGTLEPIPTDPAGFLDLRLSPDGRRLLITKGDFLHIPWIYDLDRRTWLRLVTAGDYHNGQWSADGEYVVLDRAEPGIPRDLVRKRADGTASLELLVEGNEVRLQPGSISPDGEFLAYTRGPRDKRSLWVLPLEGEREPRLVFDVTRTDTPIDVFEPIFSPDSRWIAFTTRWQDGEVYVIPFPRAEWLRKVGDGERPIWNPNGKELFYQQSGKMVAVEIHTDPEFRIGNSRVLFEDPLLDLDYDVSPDGERFYMIRESEEHAPSQINVVLNWTQELERIAPSR